MRTMPQTAVLSPNNVVRSASPAFLLAFGLEEREIVGRSLRMLLGPCTDGQRLLRFIDSATPKTRLPKTHILAALYSRDGVPLLRSVAVELADDGARIVYMERTHAVTSKQALVDDGTSKVLLSAETRQVSDISSGFADRYGFSPKAASALGLRMILGPGTDIQSLTALMDAALGGQSQRGRLLTYGSDCQALECEIIVTPVEDGMAQVSHLMLTFVSEPRRRSVSVTASSSKKSFLPTHDSSFTRVSSAGSSFTRVSSAGSQSERAGSLIKAALLFLALPMFLHLGGPMIASGESSTATLMRLAPSALQFHSDSNRQKPKGSGLPSLLHSHHHVNTDVMVDRLGSNKITLMLDLDKTVLFGNDGNDLGVALQWMDVANSKVQELYSKLINPNLKKMYEFYTESGKEVDVVIYTRRPQIVYYKSCVTSNTVPVRYADDFHGQGQLIFPSSIGTSQDILDTYVGPDLLEEEHRDVQLALDRLLAARDAVMLELGLAKPPPVVVTAQPKNIEATARQLGLPAESCLLFDDNVELRSNPRVVLVDPLDGLPSDRRANLLAFMEREVPADTLEEDLVDYLEEAASAAETSIMRDANGKLSWWIPEVADHTRSWRTPQPVCAVSHHTLPLKGAKSLEFHSDKDEMLSDVSPADVPLRAPGHGFIDLCAAAEKAIASRESDIQLELELARQYSEYCA